jgi:hypothetical protein
MKGLTMSKEQVEQHQKHHGFMTDSLRTVEAPTMPAKGFRQAKQPNKTEAAFGLILEARKRRGEIEEYRYEGLTLRWGDGMRYTPDFVVYWDRGGPVLMEIKGSHIWDRDLVRFKGCRAEWKHRFSFEMHQKKSGEWRRIL